MYVEKKIKATSSTKERENTVKPADQAIHRWYRFVLSFPPHLVRKYLDDFNIGTDDIVLDPFCGTGTTLVECKKLGIPNIGVEAMPIMHFASSVKTDWHCNPDSILEASSEVRRQTDITLGAKSRQRLASLNDEQNQLLITDSVSPLPMHKLLVLRDGISSFKDSKQVFSHLNLALAKSAVQDASNLHFGPEVGVRKKKEDTNVVESWIERVEEMAFDLDTIKDKAQVSSKVLLADARDVSTKIEPHSIKCVITSPPYPNEKDYTRTTRLESVLLGFLTNREDLRELKQSLMRSNTRNVYVKDDDDSWIESSERILNLAQSIENRRIELEKTSGFEKNYHRVTRLYFGGMKRHLSNLRGILAPGAKLAYVVGDQASFFRIQIQTGQILAEVAESLGYHVKSIDLFRLRKATATGQQLREEVVILEWSGKES